MNDVLAEFASLFAETRILKDSHRPDLHQLRLVLRLVDGSVLHVRENRFPQTGWVDYSYHWQTADHQLIRRWDNAHERQVSTFYAHHQHVGSEENVLASEPMTLEAVLRFIAAHFATSN